MILIIFQNKGINNEKIINMSALLLAALLLFTACPSEPDPNALPGVWVNTVELMSTTSTTVFQKAGGGYTGTLTPTANQTFIYNLPDPTELNDKPSAGNFTAQTYALTEEDGYTGFEAEVTSTAEYYGFCFNLTSGDSWSYYLLDLCQDSFQIRTRQGNIRNIETGWTSIFAIKPYSQKNKILVYKDVNNHIIIKINDTIIHDIENPIFSSGRVGIICYATGEECASSSAIGTTFKFTKFQK